MKISDSFLRRRRELLRLFSKLREFKRISALSLPDSQISASLIENVDSDRKRSNCGPFETFQNGEAQICLPKLLVGSVLLKGD